MVTNTELIDYLDQRGVKDNNYRKFVLNYATENYNFSLCTTNGFDYAVSHFLDRSSKKGYGLVSTNKALGTDTGRQLAIGLIEGDDVICLNLQDGQINIWMVQNGNGEHLVVAKTFQDFLDNCCGK